jgi:hypothetical protein
VPSLLISAGSGTISSLIHFARKQTAYPESETGLSLNSSKLTLGGWISLHTYANRLPLVANDKRGAVIRPKKLQQQIKYLRKKAAQARRKRGPFLGTPVSSEAGSAP